MTAKLCKKYLIEFDTRIDDDKMVHMEFEMNSNEMITKGRPSSEDVPYSCDGV